MKGRVDKLEKEFKEDIARIDGEVATLREFKHATNGTLHSHNGKLDVIAVQQNGIVSELTLIRNDLKEWADKTTGLMTLKSMAIGAGLIIPPTLGFCYFIFKWYLDTLAVN